MNNMQVDPFRDRTYYILDSEKKNPSGQGSLAINIRVNPETHIIAWQDTSLHPKSTPYHSIEHENSTVVIQNANREPFLKLVPLTIEIFKNYVHGKVPLKYQESDDSLRKWYSGWAQDPYNQKLFLE